MKFQGCRTLGSAGSENRLLHSFQTEAAAFQVANHLDCLLGRVREVFSSSPRGRISSLQRNNGGSCRPVIGGVLQQTFCCPQVFWVLETRTGCQRPEFVRGENQVPHGGKPFCHVLSPSGQLDGHPGHAGCLLSCPHPSRLEKVPEVCLLGPWSPVSGSVLRPCHSPTGFNPNPCQVASSSRDQCVPIPGWLASLLFVRGAVCEGLTKYPLPNIGVRHPYQRTEIPNDSDSEYSLLWDDSELSSYQAFPSPQKSRVMPPNSAGVSQPVDLFCSSVDKPSRNSGLSRTFCEVGQASHEAPAVPPASKLVQEASVSFRTLPSHISDQEGSLMVVIRGKTSRRNISLPSEPQPRILLQRL